MVCRTASFLRLLIPLLLLGLLAVPAAANTAWIDKWRTEASHGRVNRMQEMLTDERLASLSESDVTLFKVAYAVDEYGGPMSRTHPDAFGRLLERLHDHVSKLAEEDDSANGYRVAVAFTTAARCRHRYLNGHKKAQPEWWAAADRIARMYRKQEAAPDIALKAAAWLGEAALARAEKHEALLARAKELIDMAAEREPSERLLQTALGGWYVARARVGRVKKLKAYGKAAVVEGLAYLEPHLSAPSLPRHLATVHTDLLAENRAGRFGVKAKMRLIPHKLSAQGMIFAIPDSGEWTFTQEKGTRSKKAFQRMLRGVLRRSYQVVKFNFGANIYVDKAQSATVPATKPRAVAKAMLPALNESAAIVEVIARTKPSKAKLHKDFTDVWRIGVEGYIEDGRWARVQDYYFVRKKGKGIYVLRVTEYQKETAFDPVADHVLKSFHLAK